MIISPSVSTRSLVSYIQTEGLMSEYFNVYSLLFIFDFYIILTKSRKLKI